MASRRDSFAYHRWIPFAIVFIALASIAALAVSWPEPVPQVACDQTNLTEAHIAEARALSHWTHRGLLHLTAVCGVFVSALLYFQIGHWLLKGAAPLLALVIAMLASLASGGLWIRRAGRWVSYQSGSCLEEALREPWAASHVTWIGNAMRGLLPSVDDLPSWPWLMLGDAALMAALFITLAWLLYLGGRRQLRY